LTLAGDPSRLQACPGYPHGLASEFLYTMPTTAVPLQDLARRIAQQETELDKLRREYQVRQEHVAELKRRKQELQAQLKEINEAIRIVGLGETPPTPSPTTTSWTTPSASPAGAPPAGRVSLPQVLVGIVREAGGPITVKELAQELVRKKYPTTSRNIARMVNNRVSDLVQKGFLRRAGDRPGVVLGQPRAPVKRPTAKAPSGHHRDGQQRATAASLGKPGGEQPSLRAVLTQVLAQSPRPLPVRELAAQVKAAGYRTKSKDFVNVIWVAIGKLDNVENVPGQGYRLKRGKGKGSM
jgi:hypothetical protein